MPLGFLRSFIEHFRNSWAPELPGTELMPYEANAKDAILQAPAVASHLAAFSDFVYVAVDVEHPGPGLQFLVGALACSAFLLSGCYPSVPDVGDTGPSSPQVSDTGSSASEVGDIGTWELLNSAEVTPFSTTLQLGVGDTPAKATTWCW